MLSSRLRWMARLGILIALMGFAVVIGGLAAPSPAQWAALALLGLVAASLAWFWATEAQAEQREPLTRATRALLRATEQATRLGAGTAVADDGLTAAGNARAGDPASLVEAQSRLDAAYGSLAVDISALRTELAGARDAAARGAAAETRLLEAHPAALMIVAHTGQVQRANSAAAALLGRDGAGPNGRLAWDGFADVEALRSALDQARLRGAVHGTELELRRDDGSQRMVDLSAVLLPAADGHSGELLIVLDDVSAARQREREARGLVARTRALLDAVTDPVLLMGTEGRLLDVNAAAQALLGTDTEALTGAVLSRLFTTPELVNQQLSNAMVSGQVKDLPLALRQADGALREVLMTAEARRDGQGRAIGLFINLRDVTEVRKAERLRDDREWVIAGISRLNVIFQTPAGEAEFARSIISELAEFVGAQVGAFYVREQNGPGLSLLASHAFAHRPGVDTRVLPGEGVLGQAVLERKQMHVANLPDGYVLVASGLGQASARHLYVTPLLFENEVRGALELASLTPLPDRVMEYLRQAAPIITVAYEATSARVIAAAALAQAQHLASELEAQQDQLRSTNAELEEQTASLRVSEQKLQEQQTEIELANTELQQQNDLLERQRDETEKARKTLVIQAQEVALASKYKSEFLANMSHELRTPLNSLLLLARSLRDNQTGNLTADQVESASVIFDSGSDLLNIINEILDLSKIEAGKMELRLSDVDIPDVARTLVSQFEHMAHAQGLVFRVITETTVPERIVTDPQRMGQILKNLVGNALKFTEQGSVSVRFARPAADTRFRRSGFDVASAIAVHVTDTGIGIAENQQKVIFEAFQQADSGDRRRYGGTGLGLSISRELANLLGGEIHVSSEPGKGSTFTLYLPEKLSESAELPAALGEAAQRPPAAAAPAVFVAEPEKLLRPVQQPAAENARPSGAKASPLDDDHGQVRPQDQLILLIEDDLRFAKILIEHVRQRGFKCIHATTGEGGLDLARVYRPHGVVLDIELPAMDGWAVLSALKQDLSLRHIPVHIVSVEPASKTNLGIGAIGHATKPVAKEQIDEVLMRLESASAHAAKRVLVIEDEPLMRAETVRVIGNGNVKVDAVGTAQDGLAFLAATSYDLVVMDLGLPDMPGVELLQKWARTTDKMPPVIIHTVRELTIEEELFLRNFSDSIIIKDVRSQERLIDEVALFLHRVVQELPEEKRQAIFHLRQSDEPLRGKKVLVVEDDMRTMFAMARMLAGHGIHPIKAENGERALEMLNAHPDTDLVLLDMMMPVMDGYEVARRLREDPALQNLPVIALTAKAMREDRQRCLDAGCTDYLSKPVDPDRLTSLMRVLLFR